MPSFDLLVWLCIFFLVEMQVTDWTLVSQLHFQSCVSIVRSWYVSGKHYQRTSNAWLRLQDKNAKQGITELELDAQDGGLPVEEGRRVFFR